MKRASAGQGLLEYLLVIAALTAALFLPHFDGRPAIVLLVHSLLEYMRGASFLTSIL